MISRHCRLRRIPRVYWTAHSCILSTSPSCRRTSYYLAFGSGQAAFLLDAVTTPRDPTLRPSHSHLRSTQEKIHKSMKSTRYIVEVILIQLSTRGFWFRLSTTHTSRHGKATSHRLATSTPKMLNQRERLRRYLFFHPSAHDDKLVRQATDHLRLLSFTIFFCGEVSDLSQRKGDDDSRCHV